MHMNRLTDLLAMATPTNGQAEPKQNAMMAFLPMILLVVVFYFILIRPQQKRAKAQQKMLAALKPGDKAVTASGIIGTVLTVKDRTVSLRSGDAKFEVTKASVTDIIEDGKDTASTAA
jgi:preprotein translocase subunit YajC